MTKKERKWVEMRRTEVTNGLQQLVQQQQQTQAAIDVHRGALATYVEILAGEPEEK